ncbi:MAG: 6,7-dimethyl-8-ribityllumazine synthase [Acetobacter sp.]|nr:6,7-dimethyl-8-ribityllumazine synthase [Acetobacter sp.]MBO6086605.1 6,7-dimethyl-8-ribityllumazine synthase [Acetobacter sp.]MBO6091234.1 6,7-dimethyl-8-ribityllumazine synthase [Acetobacter sp.]MBO7072729.1 6,7-dimethyl-8-ribityllumazine synthase [Acetobacter sp.]MBO7351275.1 6,7-dimethyl-8-ribityllumazine synthase [Acetobacter sp.]
MGIRSGVDTLDLSQLFPAPHLALLVSRFNEEITKGLKEGALGWLDAHKISVSERDIFMAPGAFELPLLAKTLAESDRYEGVICLGCVVKGDTAHFEFISLSTSIGIMQASLTTDIPITFGILTTYTQEQARIRSAGDEHNKGREAAAACVESIALLRQLRGFSSGPGRFHQGKTYGRR